MIHLFALELAQIMFALVCAFMRSIGGFMRSFCGLGCVGMRHYAPVCGSMRSFALRAQICVSKDAPGKSYDLQQLLPYSRTSRVENSRVGRLSTFYARSPRPPPPYRAYHYTSKLDAGTKTSRQCRNTSATGQILGERCRSLLHCIFAKLFFNQSVECLHHGTRTVKI